MNLRKFYMQLHDPKIRKKNDNWREDVGMI